MFPYLRAHVPTKALIRGLLMCLSLLLTVPANAEAYTDPGTGAFVYQAAYAAFLGGAYYLRKFLNRFWSRRK